MNDFCRNSPEDLPDLADLPEMGHGWQVRTPLPRAGGQDDVSYNKLPQISLFYLYVYGYNP